MQLIFACKCSPAPLKHPQPHRSGEADAKLHVCLLVWVALGGRMNPLSWGHCCFLLGHLGPGSVGRQLPCPWPGIVPALPEQGHGPEIWKENIYLQRYWQRPVQASHFLHGLSLMGFPAPQEGEGFLAVTLARSDTGCCSHGRGTDSLASKSLFWRQ